MNNLFKRSVIIPVLLLIYLIVMAVIGWPYYSAQGKYLEFGMIVTVNIGVVIALFFFIRKRDRIRSNSRRRKDASDRRSFRNDDIR